MRTISIACCLLGTLALAEENDPYRLKADHERTPFSAAEIRQGCPAGRVSIFRLENINGQRMLQVFHFVKCDEKGADFQVATLSADGQKQLEQRNAHSTWVQFQSHASYPKSATTRSEARVKTPAGTFDCWRYLVVERQGEKTTEKRFFFAKRLPGPPIKMTMHVDGKQAIEMMLVEHKDGDELALLASLGIRGMEAATVEQKKKYAAEFEALESKEGGVERFVQARIYAEQASAFFAESDADSDGSLTRQELPGDKFERLFWRLDHDADGKVSRKELLDAVARWTR